MSRCKKCGNLLTGKQIKYCEACKRLAANDASKRFRDKHKKEFNERQRKWTAEHLEQRRLIARNSAKKRREERKINLREWRKNNPEKVKAQNKRAHKKLKRRRERNLCLEKGIYKTIKILIVCPKCKHRWKTKAKRPQCLCGYIFPRNYLDTLVDETKTKPCKCCGRLIPYQGRGSFRLYCECCFPQIMALKRVLGQMRCKQKNPDRFKEWYKDTTEVLVASTCVVCSTIIPYKGKGMKPFLCEWCGPKRNAQGNRRRGDLRKMPTRIEEFIAYERRRLGLDKGRKWTKREIYGLFEHYKDNFVPIPICQYQDE